MTPEGICTRALKNNMKYLKIEDNKGYYWDGAEYQEVDKINKKGILALLKAAETDDFEMDAYDENLLGNKAHQIIYENLYTKFEEFMGDKEQFKRDVDNLYREAIGKYSAEIKDEEDEGGGEEGADDGSQAQGSKDDDVPF
jgi:hypothetical protein